MGYLHINNLYKDQQILLFKECYALEKIHGTSAHIKWHDGQLTFYSGGENYQNFVNLFDAEQLKAAFLAIFDTHTPTEVTVYGEAYGGKQQGMSPTYGPRLKFVAFDVLVDGHWLQVEQAERFVHRLGLEFVFWAKIPTTIEAINAERDRPSTQAARNGISEPKISEGVVLRPLVEVVTRNGNRIIVKHKRPEFSERGRPTVELDPSKREILTQADAIAEEWVTTMRLEHVIDQLIRDRENKTLEMSDIPQVVRLMQADVEREAEGEIVTNDAVRKAIGKRTVALFKTRVVYSAYEHING